MITEPLTSVDHTEIRDVVREVVQSVTSERVRAAAQSALAYDEVAWKQMVELGWASLALDERAGGEDLGVVVQCLVHRELGARLLPSPYLATVGFAATALGLLGDLELTLPLLTDIGAGTVQAALVLTHGSGWPGSGDAGATAHESDGTWIVSGSVEMVLDGCRADTFVVVAELESGSGWGLFKVDALAAGVTRTPTPAVDATRSLADLRFEATDAVPLRSAALSTDEVSGLVDRLAIYLAAEMTGSAIACMEETLAFLRTRQQFGKPIGTFQALKHRCADLAVAITIVQEFVFAAAEMADADDAHAVRTAAPLLLARTGEIFKLATEEAIQLHGGVGFTDELDIGLYYKRALVDNELLAAPADAYARMNSLRRAEPS